MTPSKLVSIQSQNQSYNSCDCAGPKLICDRQKDDRIGTLAPATQEIYISTRQQLGDRTHMKLLGLFRDDTLFYQCALLRLERCGVQCYDTAHGCVCFGAPPLRAVDFGKQVE